MTPKGQLGHLTATCCLSPSPPDTSSPPSPPPPPHTHTRTVQQPGINYLDPRRYDRKELQELFKLARNQGAEFVAAFVHWGPNWWVPN